MRQVLIIILVIATVLFGRWLLQQPTNKRLRWLGYIAISIFIALAFFGKLHWLFAAASTALGLLPVLYKKLMMLRWFLFSSDRFRQTYKKNAQDKQQNSTARNFRSGTMTREEALEILGLKANTTREEIILAYKRLIQKLHPDRGGSSALAKKINEAKEVLLK